MTYFNEDLNEQPFRLLTSFPALYLWTNKQQLFESHSLSEGIFPTMRSKPGQQARGRIPGWPEESGRKERGDCIQRGARVEAHPWEGPLQPPVLLGPTHLSNICRHPGQPLCISLSPPLSRNWEPMDNPGQAIT